MTSAKNGKKKNLLLEHGAVTKSLRASQERIPRRKDMGDGS